MRILERAVRRSGAGIRAKGQESRKWRGAGVEGPQKGKGTRQEEGVVDVTKRSKF